MYNCVEQGKCQTNLMQDLEKYWFYLNKTKENRRRRRHTQHSNTYIATTETYQQRLSYA